MRKFWYLLIAVIGNAIGTALMSNTGLGMTAWGASSKNLALFFRISVGTGFAILSILFYIVACTIRKRIDKKEAIQSFGFLIAFSLFADFFIGIFPDFSNEMLLVRIALNIIGLLVLMFAIAVHIKLYIAVHPMDVYLSEMQKKLKSVPVGTTIAYTSAFIIAISFGLLKGSITDIGMGTINTILFGGLLIKFYNQYILAKWSF